MGPLARHAALLAAGGEIVTASPRQARALKVALAAAGEGAVWETPRILPWSAWLEREARALDDRPELLSDYVATRLWQLVVEESEAAAGLVSSASTAAEAARAWRLAADWQVDLGALEPVTREDGAFLEWSAEFRRRTAARGAIDGARLPALLAGRAAQGEGPIAFHGFSERTPARARLVAALAAGGRDPVELGSEATPGRVFHHAAASPVAEAEAIATWLAARLAAAPRARLAVIVPDLGARAGALRRLLDEALAPHRLLPGAPEARPYAFSVAPRLADYAVVETALALLACGPPVLDVVDAGRLLRSPYVAGDAGSDARRAIADAEIRARGARSLPVVAFCDAIRRHSPELAAQVLGVRDALAGASRRSAAEWAEAMLRALRAGGWPKGRVLGSAEYQVAREVTEALATLGSLTGVLGPLEFGAARREFGALVAATPFQPDAGNPPVLLLDRLEDPGIVFDGLWVSGLTADRLPAALSPTPFLPLALQRERGMPDSSPELALAGARRALDGLHRSAPEVVFSWPRQDGEARLLPSMLLPPGEPLALESVARSRAAALYGARRVVAWSDVPPAALAPGAALAGGVRVLELQALCPFRAAAELRLRAKPLETPETGLPARVRGELMHSALKHFWEALGSQAALAATDEAGRVALARRAVAAAVAGHRQPLPKTRLVALEREWLELAIVEFAVVELERAPFTIAELEVAHVVEPGGYSLGTRIDRIDRLEGGDTVLIDYKTGASAPARWAGARSDAMQLGVYAAYLPTPPVAVAIAQLRRSLRRFRGLAARDGVLPTLRDVERAPPKELSVPSWAGLLEDWHANAARLATAFAAGETAVDPAPRACEHCGLAPLCRVDSTAVAAVDDERASPGAADDA